jgi:hypothetical protein
MSEEDEKAITKEVVNCLLAACDAIDAEVERIMRTGLTRKEAFAWIRQHSKPKSSRANRRCSQRGVKLAPRVRKQAYPANSKSVITLIQEG